MSQTQPQDQSSNTPTAPAGSLPVSLIRISNPRAFFILDLQAFVLKALTTAALIEDAEQAMIEMLDLVMSDNYGLFVVREGSKYVSLVVVESVRSSFTKGCVVIHFYNVGSAAARKLLIQGIQQFATANGQTKIWGFDTNHKPRAFARLFRALGAPKSVGEVFQFEG